MIQSQKIKGQSEQARNQRIARACCPVHGLYMSPINGWSEDGTVSVGCPRKDCEVMAQSPGPKGPLRNVRFDGKSQVREEGIRSTWLFFRGSELIDPDYPAWTALKKRVLKRGDQSALARVAYIEALPESAAIERAKPFFE